MSTYYAAKDRAPASECGRSGDSCTAKTCRRPAAPFGHPIREEDPLGCDCTASRPNARWMADVTYVGPGPGPCRNFRWPGTGSSGLMAGYVPKRKCLRAVPPWQRVRYGVHGASMRTGPFYGIFLDHCSTAGS